MGPILLSRSEEDSSKIQEDLRCPAETVVEPKLWQKMPKTKVAEICKKSNFWMLQKPTYETMGRIHLNRS